MKRPQKINIRPMPLPGPRKPSVGPAQRCYAEGGPIGYRTFYLRTSATLPIVVGGVCGEYRRIAPNSARLAWHPV